MAKKGPQSQSGTRIGIQGLLQTRVQGQKRTELIREKMDGLDAAAATVSDCGAFRDNTDFGVNEEAESDDLLHDDPDLLDDPLASEGEARRERLRSGVSLETVIGSRPPVALFRLVQEGDTFRAAHCVKKTEENTEALEELRILVESCFHRGLPQLSAEERSQLLGESPAGATQRLALLQRLAVKGGDKVSGAVGKTTLHFKPNDRGLERYANKFIALPDGTPFSLRLLLLDLRGRKGEDNFFDRLPLVIKILALRRALGREQQAGKAVTDYEFGAKIQQSLEELLGVNVERPSEDHVRRRLRDNLKRNGLGHLFPKKDERQRHYDQLKAATLEGHEASS